MFRITLKKFLFICAALLEMRFFSSADNRLLLGIANPNTSLAAEAYLDLTFDDRLSDSLANML